MTQKTNIHFVPPYFQNPAHKLTVMLIGTGGTGSQVLTCLARINATLIALGHPGLDVTAVDPDTVTPANMGRQLFSPQDLQRYKSDVLIERINRFFNLNWQSVPEKFTKNGMLNYNIIISCVDNMECRKMIYAKFKKRVSHALPDGKKYYWMDFGNGNNFGQVVLGSKVLDIKSKFEKFKHVKRLPTVFDLYPSFKDAEDDNSGPSCSVAEAIEKQDLFVNSMLAQVGCNILWKLIKEGSIEYNGAFMNLKTMSVKPINV